MDFDWVLAVVDVVDAADVAAAAAETGHSVAALVVVSGRSTARTTLPCFR